MCGIYSCFSYGIDRCKLNDNYNKITPRGPDHTVVEKNHDGISVFHRLSINDVNKGQQPFNIYNCKLLCNGEIYNHKYLENKYNIKTKSNSDCEIILHLYKIIGIENTIKELDGEFAFILIDNNLDIVHFARDYIGIKPLYIRNEYDNSNKVTILELSSTIKGMCSNENVQHVKPGMLYTFDRINKVICEQVYNTISYNPCDTITYKHIFNKLTNAVNKRINNSEREVGFFLSGGIDSCTILSLAMRNKTWNCPINVYTFAFDKNAPDAVSAGKMVKWLKTIYGENSINWHLVIDTLENGIKSIPGTIKVLETYDTTTIRASTPMYMLSKYIAETTPNVKVVLTGEGSDELFGGYLYNMYCPNNWSFRSEIISALNNLHVYDVLRADRVTAGCGLEMRPPFLDKDLVDTVLSYSKLEHNKKDTKQILRDILKINNVLPDIILYGRKEAFSDAVGLNWQDSITEYSKKYYNLFDESERLNGNIQYSNETEFYFRNIFNNIFGNMFHILPKLWLPNQTWVATGNEPSARALSIYNDTQ